MTSTSAFRPVDAGAGADVDVGAEFCSDSDAPQPTARLAGNPKATSRTKLRRGSQIMPRGYRSMAAVEAVR
jgi:hypothetical protein